MPNNLNDLDWLDQIISSGANANEILNKMDQDKARFLSTRSKKRQEICKCFVCKNSIFDGDQAYRYGLRDETGTRGDIFCGKCSGRFIRCSVCCLNFLPSDIFMKHCPNCVESAPQRLIRNYSTKVHRELPRLGHSGDDIYFGVELEYECGKYGRDTLVTDSLIKGFAMLKKDSSITKGFEVVTSPASPDIHEVNFKTLFDKLPITVQPDITCGMHVHVSRVRLSDLQIGKMLKFLHNPDNEKFIITISGRPSSHHNDFKRPKKITEGLFGGKNQVHKDRHTALNLNNPETIEFRLFRGTRDISVFMKNLEFCRALVKFTGWAHYSIGDSEKFSVFFDFVRKNRKEYNFLWNFLTRAKIFDTLK